MKTYRVTETIVTEFECDERGRGDLELKGEVLRVYHMLPNSERKVQYEVEEVQ